MTDLNRRDFIKGLSITAGAITVGAGALTLSGCSTKKDKSVSTPKEYSILRVSSDLYKTELLQRFAFAISREQKVYTEGNLSVKLTLPDGSTQNIKEVKPRNKELKSQGIYSFEAVFKTSGQYELQTKYKGQELSLTFAVNEKSLAPALGSQAISIDSPTNKDHKDAKILCTRFKGECSLHDHTIKEYLSRNEPLVVLFATPARCQTSHCGPVLDILEKHAISDGINAIHIEIYKDETSPDVLDAVLDWGLPSEPWLFAIDKTGKIVKRLDGAFDLSEIEDAIASAKK